MSRRVLSVIALPLIDDVGLTLVKNEDGYRFSSWSRHDGNALPLVRNEHRQRVFATVVAATLFFRELFARLV